MNIGNGIRVVPQDNLAAKGYFFAGGNYAGKEKMEYINGQMLVEVYVPRKITKKYPLVFFHGAAQTNLCWLGTPDGRKGWADYFIEQGYVVYLAETPARGRSAYHPAAEGPTAFFTISDLLERFVGNEGDWEQAKLHTQWPENGKAPGTSIFDQFAASQVEYLPENSRTEELVTDAAADLLTRTGPAILVTHSQSAPFGWTIADRCSQYIKGIVSVEPTAPCFSFNLDEPAAQNYGIADIPLTYEPPVNTPADFRLVKKKSGIPGVKDGLVMEEPARQLPNLKSIPVLILVGEASYHADRDYWFYYVLKQAGVECDYANLGEKGIHGNGHMMMLEKNNEDIAAWINQWIIGHVSAEQGD